jgi:palmitoyltransferase
MGSRYEGRRPRQLGDWCVSTVDRLPVIITVGIIIWSYYAYVYHLCSITVTDDIQRVLYLIGYHILFAFFIWAYWQTIVTEIGGVPVKFKLPRAELQKLEEADTAKSEREILERFAEDLPVTNRTLTGSIRYCGICQHIKPDRAHHCSSCGKCVHKMDHHCFVTNTCISFTNYKFFLLLLGYNILYCLFIVLTTLSPVIECLDGDGKGIGCSHVIVLFFAAIIFALGDVCIFCYHCNLTLKNRTTLESFRTPVFRNGDDRNGFNLGKYKNFQEVFGNNKMTWFLPIFTSLGDGSSFAVRPQHQLSSYNSARNTDQS